MWGSTGRSGYGNNTIGGDYDSWDGISPNGKQYKNEITQETRNLSGADYWHLRKQNRPTEAIPASLHMLNKDRANIDAYAALDEPVKKATKVPLRQRILPQASRLDKLTAEIVELENEYRSGAFSIEEYSMLRAVAFKRRDRAVELYKRAIKPAQTTDDEDYLPPQPQHTSNTSEHTDFTEEKAANSSKKDLQVFVFGSIILFIGFQLVSHFV